MGAKLKAVGMIGIIQRYDTIQHPVLFDSDFITVYGESKSFGLQLHAYVHKWTPSTRKKIHDVLVHIAVFNPDPVFALATNPKLKKFCEIMGFVSIDEVYDPEGNLIGELMFVPNSGAEQECNYV